MAWAETTARTGRRIRCGRRISGYRTVNRANWDDRAQAPAASADYAVARFVSEPTHLDFEQVESQVWNRGGTYAETDVEFTHNVTHEWNHGLGEIVTAVLEAGMTVSGLVEHLELGERRLRGRPGRLPHSYPLQAVRNAV